MDMDTQDLLSQEADYTRDWDWDGWVIMMVPRFAGFVGGLFHGQSFYLYTLWHGIQDPGGNGNLSG